MKRLLFGLALAACRARSRAGHRRGQESALSLDIYRALVSQGEYADLFAKGYDIAAAEDVASGKVQLDIVLDKSQVDALRETGVASSS